MTNTQNQLSIQNLHTQLTPAAQTVNNGSVFKNLLRITRLALLFAYISLPMWASWLGYYTNYREISSNDMLLAMAWMPISSAIIALSFMKDGRKHFFKASFVFVLLNAIAGACLVWWM